MTGFELQTRMCGGYCVAVLRGELDVTNAGAAATVLAAGQHLIIDLQALDFLDCHAAGMMLRVRQAARGSGGDVLLAAAQGPVLRLLTLIGVADVHPSVSAAAGSAGWDHARQPAAGIPRSAGPVPSCSLSRMAADGPAG